ncbi:hypothetical protein [Sphingomonas sp. 8AM]|uniref:hypothetical protein n=1 Tax=Sphingomonas sp. 8AM TaxID=2653170 RepID=UPI001359CD1A|nr:hypothetical protein [Sphingomonas sp. 8AM]
MALITQSSWPKALLAKWRWWASVPAVRLSMLLLLAGVYFGSSRSFGAFLLSIPMLAGLLLIAVAAAIKASVKRVERTHLLAAWLLIGLTPFAYLLSYEPVQQLRFLFWAVTHYRQVAEASKASSIVVGWDSWGMAGQDTFSYLAVDSDDRLGSQGRAIQWTKEVGQSCGLWKTQRVWPRFYIVTTYTNCPYDRIEPAE